MHASLLTDVPLRRIGCAHSKIPVLPHGNSISLAFLASINKEPIHLILDVRPDHLCQTLINFFLVAGNNEWHGFAALERYDGSNIHTGRIQIRMSELFLQDLPILG